MNGPSMSASAVGNATSPRLFLPLEHSFRWLLARPALLGAALLNLVFLFLPFYDPNNVPLALAVTSHFTSTYPPGSYNSWVAGMFVYSAFVPGDLAYLASGFQIYWTYTCFKAIYFAMTGWMAYALYQVFRRRSETLAQGVAVFVLANPAWIFVSYIWTEYDIIPVAFATVGYLVLRYSGPAISDRRRVLTAVLLLAVSAFFYWYALILIPTLLYYSKSRAELLRILAAVVAVFATLFAATVYVFSGSTQAYSSALVGGTSALNRSNFFGFQFFLRIPALPYLALVGVLVLLLPLALKRLRFTEPATLLVVVTLFVFTSAVPMPDNYVFVFPFALLAFLLWKPRDTHFRWLWGLLAYPLVGLFLVNFMITNSQPDSVGVLYFGYDLFHSNLHLVNGPAQLTNFLWVFNILLVGAIVLSFAILTRNSRTEPAGPLFPTGAWFARSNAPKVSEPRKSRRVPVVAAVAVVGVLLALSLLFNATAPNQIQYSGSGTAPIYFLTPNLLPSDGGVVRPIAGESYTFSGNSIQIATPAPPLSFNRWFHADGATLAGTVGLAGITPRSTLAIDGTPFKLWLNNDSAPSLAGAVPVPPSFQTGVRAGVNASVPPGGGAPPSYYGDYSYTVYPLSNPGWQHDYYTFLFDPGERAPLHTALFYLQNSQEYLAVESDANGTAVVYTGWLTGNVTHAITLGGIVPLDQWSYAIVHQSATGVQYDVNGLVTTVSLPMFTSGQTQLLVGSPTYNGSGNNTFLGYATPLYASQNPFPILPSYGYSVEGPNGMTNATLAAPSVNFSIQSSPSGTLYRVDETTVSSGIQTTEFAIGKFSAAPYTVTISLDRFDLTEIGVNHYYLVPVFWAAVGPFLLVALSFPLIRRTLGPRPPSGDAARPNPPGSNPPAPAGP
jgi:hypothetical protein